MSWSAAMHVINCYSKANKRVICQFVCIYMLCPSIFEGPNSTPGFSLCRLHMGGFGRQVQGGKSINGGLIRGDIDLMGGHRPYGTLDVVSSSITIKSGVLTDLTIFFSK